MVFFFLLILIVIIQNLNKKNFLLDAIRTDRNNKTIFNRRKCGAINEISKQVPRWSYNLVDELEQETERMTKEAQIRCAPIVRSAVFSGETDPLGFFSGLNKTNENEDKTNDNEVIPH